jgi:DNA topoisomerase-1
LHLKTSRSGGFVGCGNYPDCRYTRPIGGDAAENGDRVLGEDENGNEISLRSGRFGPYVQRGEATEDNKKPERASLPKGWKAEDMTLEKALTLLSLPREVGQHPDGGAIKANFGRFGPYLMHQLPDEAKPVYANLRDPADVFEIGMNRAVELLAEKRANPGGRGRAAAKSLRDLGEHPDGGPVQVFEGRYGPYVKWGKVNATLPKETPPEAITLEAALDLIAAKAAKPGGKKKAAPVKATAKKPAAKKTTAKPATGKKAG